MYILEFQILKSKSELTKSLCCIDYRPASLKVTLRPGFLCFSWPVDVSYHTPVDCIIFIISFDALKVIAFSINIICLSLYFLKIPKCSQFYPLQLFQSLRKTDGEQSGKVKKKFRIMAQNDSTEAKAFALHATDTQFNPWHARGSH